MLALRALSHFEGDLLAFLQRLEAAHVDCGEVREQIFAIHLGKRQQNPEGFDLTQLAEASDGFSGAEIEQAVVSALYSAAAQEQPLDNLHLLQELADTSPLSVVMAENLQQLRAWAADRTVPA